MLRSPLATALALFALSGCDCGGPTTGCRTDGVCAGGQRRAPAST